MHHCIIFVSTLFSWHLQILTNQNKYHAHYAVLLGSHTENGSCRKRLVPKTAVSFWPLLQYWKQCGQFTLMWRGTFRYHILDEPKAKLPFYAPYCMIFVSTLFSWHLQILTKQNKYHTHFDVKRHFQIPYIRRTES